MQLETRSSIRVTCDKRSGRDGKRKDEKLPRKKKKSEEEKVADSDALEDVKDRIIGSPVHRLDQFHRHSLITRPE